MNKISKQLLKIANEVNMLNDKNLYEDILQLLKDRMLNNIQCPNINGFKILGQCRSGIRNQTVQCGVDFNYYYNYNAQPTNPSIMVKIFVNGFNNKLYYQAEINYFSFPQIDSNGDFARTRSVYRQYIDQDDSVQNCINLVIKSINEYLHHPHTISCLQNASPFKDRRVPYNSYRANKKFASAKKIKFTDFIKQDIDIDTNDGVVDWQIAFCGPIQLTESGKKKFRPLFDKYISYDDSVPYHKYATALNLNDSEAKLFRQFLREAAGYGSHYDEWFMDYKRTTQQMVNYLLEPIKSPRSIAMCIKTSIDRRLLKNEKQIQYLKYGIGDDQQFYGAMVDAMKLYINNFYRPQSKLYSQYTKEQFNNIVAQLEKRVLEIVYSEQYEIEEQLSRLFRWKSNGVQVYR